jgi:hypothetical protein
MQCRNALLAKVAPHASRKKQETIRTWISLHYPNLKNPSVQKGRQGGGDAAGNLVHVTLSVGRQATALFGVLLYKANLLQLLEDVPDNTACIQ